MFLFFKKYLSLLSLHSFNSNGSEWPPHVMGWVVGVLGGWVRCWAAKWLGEFWVLSVWIGVGVFLKACFLVWARITMKATAKCDKQRDSVNHLKVERANFHSSSCSCSCCVSLHTPQFFVFFFFAFCCFVICVRDFYFRHFLFPSCFVIFFMRFVHVCVSVRVFFVIFSHLYYWSFSFFVFLFSQNFML